MRKQWMDYNMAMWHLGFSRHAHQLQKRRAKYPNEFCTIDGVVQISSALVFALLDLQKSLDNLLTLKNQPQS